MMVHEEKNNVASYFGPMKISLKNKLNISNNMTQTDRFLAEKMKIIFKISNAFNILPRPSILPRMYFCFNITDK